MKQLADCFLQHGGQRLVDGIVSRRRMFELRDRAVDGKIPSATGSRGGGTGRPFGLDTFVRARAVGAWRRLMGVFWTRFGRWCEKAIPNNWLR